MKFAGTCTMCAGHYWFCAPGAGSMGYCMVCYAKREQVILDRTLVMVMAPCWSLMPLRDKIAMVLSRGASPLPLCPFADDALSLIFAYLVGDSDRHSGANRRARRRQALYILLARMPLEGERSYIGIMRSANNWDRCQYNVAVHFRRDLLERILSFVV